MEQDPIFRIECLQRLFATYPPPVDDPDLALAVYVAAIRPYEDRDLGEAVNRLMTAQVEGVDPRFRPPAPLLAAVVRRCMNERLDSERRSRPVLPRHRR